MGEQRFLWKWQCFLKNTFFLELRPIFLCGVLYTDTNNFLAVQPNSITQKNGWSNGSLQHRKKNDYLRFLCLLCWRKPTHKAQKNNGTVGQKNVIFCKKNDTWKFGIFCRGKLFHHPAFEWKYLLRHMKELDGGDQKLDITTTFLFEEMCGMHSGMRTSLDRTDA